MVSMRATLKICVHAALAATFLVTAAHAAEDLRFRVMLNDKEIGHHRFSVARESGLETVSITADFDVTFWAIPVYSYDHSAREVWKQGCLDEIVTRTDDNGKQYLVDGIAQGGTFTVETGEESFQLAERCVMTFAYWNREFLNQSKLLNSQTGEYMDVDISYEGMELLSLGAQDVNAMRYRVTNPAKELDIRVWYDESSGKWLSLESDVGKGRTIRYLPIDADPGRGADRRMASARAQR